MFAVHRTAEVALTDLERHNSCSAAQTHSAVAIRWMSGVLDRTAMMVYVRNDVFLNSSRCKLKVLRLGIFWREIPMRRLSWQSESEEMWHLHGLWQETLWSYFYFILQPCRFSFLCTRIKTESVRQLQCSLYSKCSVCERNCWAEETTKLYSVKIAVQRLSLSVVKTLKSDAEDFHMVPPSHGGSSAGKMQ